MSLKGPSVAESENLNPWHWKLERAPRHWSTEPSSVHSVNDFERMEASESHQESEPKRLETDIHPYVDMLVISKEAIAALPAAQERLNTQDHLPVTENLAADLEPQTASSEAVQPEISPTLQTKNADLAPCSLPDLLEGYVERYFLKQDGYDELRDAER